jgi:hypothetical protein
MATDYRVVRVCEPLSRRIFDVAPRPTLDAFRRSAWNSAKVLREWVRKNAVPPPWWDVDNFAEAQMPTSNRARRTTQAGSRVSFLTFFLVAALCACDSGGNDGTATGTAGSSGGPGGAGGSSGATSGGAGGPGGASASGGSGGSSGSAGQGGGASGSAGRSGAPSDAATDGFATDAHPPIDGAIVPDAMTRDRNDDAFLDRDGPSTTDGGDPNCPLPTPAPVPCFVASPAPPPTPLVRCSRALRELVDPGSVLVLSPLRLKGDTLYFAVEHAIMQKKGAAAPDVLVSAPIGGMFDVDDVALYFVITTDAGLRSLQRMNLDRTGMTTLIPNFAGTFALDQDRIYFDSADGHVVSTSKTPGGSVDDVFGPQNLAQIAGDGLWLIDATHIYWNEGNGMDFTVKRVAKGTANVETVATQLPGPALLLQGDDLIFIADNKYILQVPKSGGCPKLLVVASTFGIEFIAADDNAIYWRSTVPSDLGDMTLNRTPRTGGVEIEVLPPFLAGVRSGWPYMLLTPSQVIVSGEIGSSKPTIQVLDR